MSNPVKALREARGLSLQALADLVGTTRQQVHKLESGERRLSIDWLLKLAAALSVDPKDLLPPEQAPAFGGGERQAPPGAPSGFMPGTAPSAARIIRLEQTDPRDMIPIRSAGRGGDGQIMFLEDGPIGYTRRPSSLSGVRDGYAIYMVGDSMSPRYEPGWLLHVNPYKPPKSGRDVVVTLADNVVLVKTYRGYDGTDLVLQQMNPPEDIRLDRATLRDVHLIVGVDQEG
ncbi:MAG TPA: LexA family transcriptional regulator [Stellaceae bacterium]|nr:LexA family transcriptional regulator [Stellaceae bacterium]